MSSAPVFWLGFHVLLAVLGLAVLGCGRVGVYLLPLDRAGASGGPSTDAAVSGADAAVDGGVWDAGAGMDASADAANPDAALDASTDAAGRDGAMDASADGGPDAAEGGINACDPTSYTPDATCGVGYCRSTNSPSSCVGGVETLCQPGAPLSSDDHTPDGVDDDCDGQVDEDTCTPHSDVYRAGSYTITSPIGCGTASVKLWGGAGAAGDAQAGYWMDVTGGQGGPGGYATNVFTVNASAMLQLYVGHGGKACGAAGSGGLAGHNGGVGGTGTAQAGVAGADGSRMGGKGGNSSSGGDGGEGSLGGGGGGAGTDPGFAPHGGAGGGGAASVLIFNGTMLIAGGGGGGGGAGSDLTTAGHSGGNGGSGCSGAGLVATAQGGGGGGGGACLGATTHAGSGRAPYDPATQLASGAAAGGDPAIDCDPGGDGYAIVTFSP